MTEIAELYLITWSCLNSDCDTEIPEDHILCSGFVIVLLKWNLSNLDTQ